MADAMELSEESPSHYTYADYLEWEGPERYEVMYGDAYMMASPSVEHQEILRCICLKQGSVKHFLQRKRSCAGNNSAGAGNRAGGSVGSCIT
jgi:Uma2 family endonuclease